MVEAAGILPLSRLALVAMDGPVLSPASSLAIRAREGDDAAFDQLMASTQDRILSLAWRLLGNSEDARDAAQETYLRVYRHLGRYRPDHDFEAWLYRIAINVCRDFHRHRRRGGLIRSLEGESAARRMPEPRSESDSEATTLEEERRRLVLEALAALPPRQRAALVLHDLEGKTLEQVARILGSRPGTVRSQLAAGRARLKRAFALLIHRPEGRIR